MIETKFSRFLRAGGHGEFLLFRSGNGYDGFRLGLAAKSDMPGYARLRASFEARLARADQVNRDLILRAAAAAFDPSLTAADLADARGDIDAALAEWERRVEVLWDQWPERPGRLTPLRRSMEASLIASFAGLINERRQRGLGIDQYVWRSQDDAKVRDLHAGHDDQVFDWDDPPEGGHPGQAYNCRCHAEPLVLDEPEYVPDVGLGYRLRRAGAEIEGIEEATADFAGDIADTIADLPGQALAVGRFGVLLAKEARDALSEAEAEELRQMRAAIAAKLEEIKEILSDLPEIAEAFADYAIAVQERPAMLDAAYRQGLATEAQVRDAFRDRSYMRTLVALNVAPGALLAKLMRRIGRKGDLGDAKTLRDNLLETAAKARRDPTDVDWDVVENPGIVWSGPIREQGGPSEDALEAAGGLGQRTPPTFKTFDFWELDTRVATSAKTLDTRARSYRDQPSQVYGRLKKYINEIDRYDVDRNAPDLIDPNKIVVKRLELAVPAGTTPEQIVQIQRAIEYAASLAIEMKVSAIR